MRTWIFITMLVKKVFQLVMLFLANFNDTQKNFINFFAYEYQKYAEFYADSKSVEMTAKSALRKSYSSKIFQVSSKEEDKLCYRFLLLYLFSSIFGSSKPWIRIRNLIRILNRIRIQNTANTATNDKDDLSYTSLG
jgi:hypothetical protein